MTIKANEIKETVARNFPQKMTYKRGKSLQIKVGRTRRSVKRTVGVSDDRAFSVELAGTSKNLEWIEFMFGMHDPAKAASAAVCIERVIQSIYPDWVDAERDWLKEQIEKRQNGRHGKVKTRFMLLPANPPLPVMFVKVKR